MLYWNSDKFCPKIKIDGEVLPYTQPGNTRKLLRKLKSERGALFSLRR